MIRKSTILMGLVSYFLLAQCLAPLSNGEGRSKEVLIRLAQDWVLVHYEDLEAKTLLLAEKAASFCAAPTQEGLLLVRAAWWDARSPFKKTQIVKFGPMTEYPLRLGPKMDDWPVNEGAVEELVVSDSSLEQSGFDAMGSAKRGFPVIEYLLWAKGDNTLLSLTEDTRRCDVLVGATGDIHANATRLSNSWEDDWIVQVTEPESVTDGAYKTIQDVVDEWVNRMAFTVENIRLTHLGKPMGDKADGEPQPDTIECRYSGRSLNDMRDALTGVQQVWKGPENEEQLGIRDLVLSASLVSVIDELFETSITTLASVPETLEESVLESPQKIKDAQEALKELQIAIQADLAALVGVTISFNDTDGD